MESGLTTHQLSEELDQQRGSRHSAHQGESTHSTQLLYMVILMARAMGLRATTLSADSAALPMDLRGTAGSGHRLGVRCKNPFLSAKMGQPPG